MVDQYCKKGAGVFVEGSLRLDTWEKDGEKKSKIKVTADRVNLASDRKPDAGGSSGSSSGSSSSDEGGVAAPQDNVEEEPFH